MPKLSLLPHERGLMCYSFGSPPFLRLLQQRFSDLSSLDHIVVNVFDTRYWGEYPEDDRPPLSIPVHAVKPLLQIMREAKKSELHFPEYCAGVVDRNEQFKDFLGHQNISVSFDLLDAQREGKNWSHELPDSVPDHE